MSIHLSDEDITRALHNSGVPKIFRDKKMSLTTMTTGPGPRLKKFVDDRGWEGLITGAVMEICGSTHMHSDAFYLLVRALVLHGVPVRIVYAEDLKPSNLNDEMLDTLNEYRVLAIEGMTPQGGDPFGKERFSIEWRLQRWLNDGRGMILLTDGQIAQFDLWSNRFRSLVNSRLVAY